MQTLGRIVNHRENLFDGDKNAMLGQRPEQSYETFRLMLYYESSIFNSAHMEYKV